MALAFLVDAYDEEILTDDKGKEDKRVVMRFHPALAPFKAAVLPPFQKAGPRRVGLHQKLAARFVVDYDETGSIGKRYRRQDEIGTPSASPTTSTLKPTALLPQRQPRQHGAGGTAHGGGGRLAGREDCVLASPATAPPRTQTRKCLPRRPFRVF